MINRLPFQIGFSLGALLLLAGCANNALRLDYATDILAKGKVAAMAARQFLVPVDETRTSAPPTSTLVAIDPAYMPNSAIGRIRPRMSRLGDPTEPPRGWLCAPKEAGGITYDRAFALAPFGDDLRPAFVLIDALAS